MPCVIICKNNGQVLVNSLPEAPPEYIKDAVPASSVDEATQMAKEVLDGPQAGAGGPPGQDDPEDQQDNGADEDQEDASGQGQPSNGNAQPDASSGAPNPFSSSQPRPSGTEGMPLKSQDQQMAAGFKRAKKGY